MPDFLHEVLRSAWTIAALSVPQADKVELFRTEARRGFQHVQIVAFISILIGSKGTELVRRDVQRRARFHRKEPGAPVGVGKIDRVCKKFFLPEGQVKLERQLPRQDGLCKEQVAAARSPADG